MEVETLTVGTFQVNCYVLHEASTAVVVDPGDDADRILDRLDDLGVTVEAILLTHAHVDHVMALAEVRRATGAPVWLHPADRDIYDGAHEHARGMLGRDMDPLAAPDRALEPGSWEQGPLSCTVLPTPGHTPGGVSLHFADEDLVLVGDCLFAGGIGRTDLGGDRATLISSIREVLLDLPDETVVLPGHGPPTTIRRERETNPFLA